MSGSVVIAGILITLGIGLFVVNSAKFPFQKKKLVIFGILGLYSSILIGQKFLEPPKDKSSLEIVQSTFKMPEAGEFTIQRNLGVPEIKDFLDVVESRLEIKIDKANKQGPGFYIVQGEQFAGKTTTFLSYLQHLKNEGLSVYYIDFMNLELASQTENYQNFLKYNQYVNVKDFFQKQNKNGVTPVLLIDHFEFSFPYMKQISNSNQCFACITLNQIYHENSVNIIVLSNSPYTRKLFYMNGGNKWNTFKDFQRSEASQIQILRQLSNLAQDPVVAQKTSTSLIERCLKLMDFNFDFFAAYTPEIKNSQDLFDFCKSRIELSKRKLQQDQSYHDLLKSIVEIQYYQNDKQYKNSWVTWGQIKEHLNNNFESSLKDAIDDRYIQTKPGKFRINSKLNYSTILHVLFGTSIEKISFQF